MKTCTLCKQDKPLLDFYKNRTRKDGLTDWCKECAKRRVQEYQATPQGQRIKQEYNQSEAGKAAQKRHYRKRSKTEHRKKQQAEGLKKHRKKYPQKTRARRKVSDAVRYEKMPRVWTQRCIFCLQQAEQYHHHNGYKKEHELDVVPICKKCHIEVHSAAYATET